MSDEIHQPYVPDQGASMYLGFLQQNTQPCTILFVGQPLGDLVLTTFSKGTKIVQGSSGVEFVPLFKEFRIDPTVGLLIKHGPEMKMLCRLEDRVSVEMLSPLIPDGLQARIYVNPLCVPALLSSVSAVYYEGAAPCNGVLESSNPLVFASPEVAQTAPRRIKELPKCSHLFNGLDYILTQLLLSPADLTDSMLRMPPYATDISFTDTLSF